jgi:hypothetical protein
MLAGGRRVRLVLVVDAGVGREVVPALVRVLLVEAAGGLDRGVEVGGLARRERDRGVGAVRVAALVGALVVVSATRGGHDGRDHRGDGHEGEDAAHDQLQPAPAGGLAGLGLLALFALATAALLLLLAARHARERSDVLMNGA